MTLDSWNNAVSAQRTQTKGVEMPRKITLPDQENDGPLWLHGGIQAFPDELDYVNAQLHPLVRDPDDKSFLGTFLQACLRADGENYAIIRPALQRLMEKYPARADRLAMERRDRGAE